MPTPVYYLIPRIRVEEYRANAGAYILGVPQPTAVAGLAYALALALGSRTSRALVQNPSVAIGYSEFSGFNGMSLNSRHTVGSNADAKTPAAIDDRVRASVTMTLLLELVFEDGVEPPTALEVKEQLLRMRLQSGSLFCSADAVMSSDITELLPAIPRDCFFLTDASAVMQETLDADSDLTTWQAMASLIERPLDSEEYKPSYVPVLVGWRALQAPTAEKELKNSVQQHAAAEPAVGVAQFRSAGAFKRQVRLAADQDAPIFWQHSDTHPMYVVRGTSPFIELFIL